MTKMPKKENLKHISLAAALVAVLMMPNITMLSANADVITDPSAASAQQLPAPAHAIKVQQEIYAKLKGHPDWVGMLAWNATTATIKYVGPASSNPYAVKAPFMTGSNTSPSSTLSPQSIIGTSIAVKDAISKDSTASTTAIFKETADYNLVQAPSSTTVDNLQVLNALNSNSQKWLQMGTVYDHIGAIPNKSTGWYLMYQRFSSCTTNELNIADGPYPFNNNDPVRSFIYGTSTPGMYTMGVTDNLALVGGSLTFGVLNDNGVNTINLGQLDLSSTCHFSSAGMVEQWSSTGSTWQFGSEQYTYNFYDTPSAPVTTAVQSFMGKVPANSPVSVFEHPTSHAYDTFTY